MKVYIRNVDTGQFYREHGVWVADHSGAKLFDSVQDAVQTCHREQISWCEVVMAFEDSRDDICLPLPNPGSRP